MSLVNDMLRDLEQRSGRATEPLAGVLPAHTCTARQTPNIVVPGFVLLVAVAALLGLAQRTSSVGTPVTMVTKPVDQSSSTPLLSPGVSATAQPDEPAVAAPAGLHRYRLDYRLASRPAARPTAQPDKPPAVSVAAAAPVAAAPFRAANVASAPDALPAVGVSSTSLAARREPMNALTRTHVTRVDPAVQLRSDGLAALQRGHPAQAGQHFGKLVRLTPSDTEAHLLLYRALAAQSRVPQARAVLSHALKVSAEPVRIAAVLARDLLDAGDSAAAQALLERYRGDGDLEYVALLAAVYERNGDYELAAGRYVYLVSQQPGHAPWWIGLAITADALGRREQAREAFERARRSRGLDPALARYANERLKSMDSTP